MLVRGHHFGADFATGTAVVASIRRRCTIQCTSELHLRFRRCLDCRLSGYIHEAHHALQAVEALSKSLLIRETQNSSQLHTVLRERLRQSLLSQPPGERVASERILAKEFGVSTATVSRALQELQQEGILRRIPGKGTYLAPATSEQTTDEWRQDHLPVTMGGAEHETGIVRSSAASLSHLPLAVSTREVPETNVNALIVVQLEAYETALNRSSESWPHRIVSRLEYRITSQGGNARTTVGHALTEEQCRLTWKEALAEGINCVFFLVNERSPLVDIWSEQFIQQHIGNGSPQTGQRAPHIVQISLAGMQYSYFDTISFDGEWGAYLATIHLLNQGHRRIAFVAPPSSQEWLQHRIRGFHRAMRGFGIVVPRETADFGVVRTATMVDGPQMWSQIGENAADLIASDTSISAVLMANDQMALPFIARAVQLGRSVPESLSVVGYDDRFDSVMKGLTTVHPPIEEIADAALNLAQQRLLEPQQQSHVHLMLKPLLMVRSTTRKFADLES